MNEKIETLIKIFFIWFCVGFLSINFTLNAGFKDIQSAITDLTKEIGKGK